MAIDWNKPLRWVFGKGQATLLDGWHVVKSSAGLVYAVDADGRLSGLGEPGVENVPEPTVKPWTFETAPGVPIAVRTKDTNEPRWLFPTSDAVRIVFWDGKTAVETWEFVLKTYELLDGSPCGEVVKDE